MRGRPLQILWLSHVPPSPPRFGAQVRMHGLLKALARVHEITAVSLIDESFDPAESEREMRAYCREVVLVRNDRAVAGWEKRVLQARSVLSWSSFERLRFAVPELAHTVRTVCSRRRFEVHHVEFPCISAMLPRVASATPLILDCHNVEYDILRQVARSEAGLVRRTYNALNWRKVRREERSAWIRADGVAVCSRADEQRVLGEVPGARTAVVPNGVDVDAFRRRASDPAPDGRTVLFFGALHYFPNVDAVLFFVRDIWPRIVTAHPSARLRIIGPHPPEAILALRSGRIEVTGFVDDLRPNLAQAAVIVVPLRIGGGTRLKIVEALAMAKPIVSTRIGAEGLDLVDGRDVLLADDPERFAKEVGRVLSSRSLAATLGNAGRTVAEAQYSWSVAADRLERLYEECVAAPAPLEAVGA